MTHPVDILVHVSGPSRGRDDARYRSEAKGFLDFEPVERLDLLGGEENATEDTQEILSNSQDLTVHEEAQVGKHHEHCVPSFKEGGNIDEGLYRAEKKKSYGTKSCGENDRQERQNHRIWQPNIHDLAEAGKQAKEASKIWHTPLKQGNGKGDIHGERLAKLQEGFLKGLQVNHARRQQGGSVSGHLRQAIDQPASLEIISQLNASASLNSPSTGIQETPHILVGRTPALPRPRTAPTGQSNPQEHAPILRRTQSDSWQTPPSTIPDSQPNMPSSGPLEISSSPCLKRPFLSSSPSPTRNSPPDAKRPRIQVPSSPPTEEPAAGISQSSATPRPPPSPVDDVPSPDTERPQSQVPSSPLMEPPAIEISQPSTPPRPSTPTRPPPSSSSIDYTPSPPPAPTPPSPSFCPLYPSRAPLPHSPSQIWPPFPKRQAPTFTTHITPSMTSVISRLPLSRGFTPFVQHQTRPFETLERGTWFIPTTTWPPQTRTDFWDHMKITVGEGRLGWGIFVRREMVQIRDGMEVFGGKLAERTDEVVKVSCWGEVAREVWVFLWIFSSRAVKGLGARWIDASGEAVAVMK